MHKIFSLFLILSLVCCSPKIIPLKGSYPSTPIIEYSDNSVDKVWDKIIDFFAQNGLSIKIIDRSSGLIISESSELTWTFEDKKGNQIKPGRWVAIPMVIAPGADKATSPYKVLGEWNVRIKSAGDKTSINVNLVNIRARFATYSMADRDPVYTRVDGRSTGVFEKQMFEIFK